MLAPVGYGGDWLQETSLERDISLTEVASYTAQGIHAYGHMRASSIRHVVITASLSTHRLCNRPCRDEGGLRIRACCSVALQGAQVDVSAPHCV